MLSGVMSLARERQGVLEMMNRDLPYDWNDTMGLLFGFSGVLEYPSLASGFLRVG